MIYIFIRKTIKTEYKFQIYTFLFLYDSHLWWSSSNVQIATNAKVKDDVLDIRHKKIQTLLRISSIYFLFSDNSHSFTLFSFSFSSIANL